MQTQAFLAASLEMLHSVSTTQTDRPNSLSVCWTSHGFESVPAYESAIASNDPHAKAFRLLKTATAEHYNLRCDVSGETFSISPIEEPRSKKSQEKSLAIRSQSSIDPATDVFGQISAVLRKKLNLKQREPVVKLSSAHGEIPLRLFRGGYCGFMSTDFAIEYYWQLRYHEKRIGERGPAKFKDAVLRRALKNELSTMSGMYVPNQSCSSTREVSVPTRAVSEPGEELGRLLLRTDLDSFDRDLAIISFIAVLTRVIEAEVSYRMVSLMTFS